jgi:hypothetical protein
MYVQRMTAMSISRPTAPKWSDTMPAGSRPDRTPRNDAIAITQSAEPRPDVNT